MKRNNVCHSDLFTKGALLNHQDQTYKICLNLPIQESPMITKVEVLHWWMLLFSKSQLEINNNNMIPHVCFVHMLQLQENHK